MSDATIAAALHVDPIDIRAIRYVETSGRMDSSTAAAVRFEPHVFWKAKLGMPNATGAQVRDALTPAQLTQVPYTPCNAAWRTAHGLAPCGHDRAASEVASETNRAAFNRAKLVDARQAVLSSSWGLFQVLGGDTLDLYGTPQGLLAAFDANPLAASEALFVHYMRGRASTLAALRAKNYPLFVALYNGCCGPRPRVVGGLLLHEDGTPCTGCDGYLVKYRRGLTSFEPAAEAAGGGLLLAAAAGLGLWWWSRRRR